MVEAARVCRAGSPVLLRSQGDECQCVDREMVQAGSSCCSYCQRSWNPVLLKKSKERMSVCGPGDGPGWVLLLFLLSKILEPSIVSEVKTWNPVLLKKSKERMSVCGPGDGPGWLLLLLLLLSKNTVHHARCSSAVLSTDEPYSDWRQSSADATAITWDKTTET